MGLLGSCGHVGRVRHTAEMSKRQTRNSTFVLLLCFGQVSRAEAELNCTSGRDLKSILVFEMDVDKSSETQKKDEAQPPPKRMLIDDGGSRIKPKIQQGAPCMPGQKICIANEYFEAGEGAYEFGNMIYAAVVGFLHVEEFVEQELTVISVQRKDDKPPFTAPYVGAIVTCVVLSRTPKLCRCLITHVGSVKLLDMVKGIIRREYITEKHRDLAEIETSFGIGDTVIARIVGIGDGDFICSTGEDTLGVVTSISKAGFYMVPIGWTKMECPRTKEVVPKKVAKVVQDRNVDYWRKRNEELRLKDKNSEKLSKNLKKEFEDDNSDV